MNIFEDKFEVLQIPVHGVRLPEFEIDARHKQKAGASDSIGNYDFLRVVCLNGFKKLELKKGSAEYKKYVDRAKHELSIIEELGFTDYMLLVWDVINFCKESDIPTGLGRGSAAGSLVLFLMGVTGIDPIEHGLYFERFISKIRAKKQVVDGVTYLDGSLMCDIDLDICYYNRPRVLEYLENKFKGKTSKIVTLNTLSGKLLIKECGKIVAEKSEQEMNYVSSTIPKTYGKVKDIEEAYEEEKSFKEWCEDNKETYRIALKLRNLIKNKGIHPSGMLLSYGKMEDCCPTELSSDKNNVSAYDMDWASTFNVKLDLLGLRGVSVSNDACKSVGIELANIDLNDPIIYQNLQDLRTPHGLFQIEADLAYRVCNKVKPKNLEELSAVLALARPGAMAFTDQYADYSNSGEYQPIHPFFDDILLSTGGVALYQEQLMQMANKIGFSLDEAEILRRIVGKKKVAEVRKWKKKIREKVKENGLDKEVGEVLWKVLEDSANYSFNKSHSVAYAALAAITVYLKFTYPQQFFLSLLKMTRNEPDPTYEISRIQKELAAFNIKLLSPHITKSEMDFSLEGKDIRFGLLSIKGISDKSIEKLGSFKSKYSNKFEIFESAKQAGLNIGVLSSLLQAGALEDSLSVSRPKVVYEAQLWNILTEREKGFAMKFSEEYNYDLVKVVKKLSQFKNEKGKEIIKASRMETIRRKSNPYKEIYLINSKYQKLANWFYEKRLLGYSYSAVLKDVFGEKRRNLVSIQELRDLEVGERVVFMGMVEDFKKGTSKNKNKYLKLDISDEFSFINVLVFNKSLEECEKMNNGLPKKENIVLIKGVKKEDAVFANLITVQDVRIYTKLSELKAQK